MGGLSNKPIPDLYIPLTPNWGVEKSPFQIAAKQLQIDKMSRKHTWEHNGWLWSKAMNNRAIYAKFSKQKHRSSTKCVHLSSGLIIIVVIVLLKVVRNNFEHHLATDLEVTVSTVRQWPDFNANLKAFSNGELLLGNQI